MRTHQIETKADRSSIEPTLARRLRNQPRPGTFSGLLDVSVLVPAHNEEGTIQVLLERAVHELDAQDLRFEVIVVDDGSTDGTGSIAVDVAQNDGGRVRVVRRNARSGKGAALVTASQNARGAVVVVLDADMEYRPEQIAQVIDPIIAGQCDVVFGSRFTGQHDGMSLSHFVGNLILTKATNLLYHARLTDVMTGYKAFRRTALEQLNVGCGGFTFEVEVAAKALNSGLRIVEVPIKYSRRSEGRPKIKWTDGIKCLLHLLEMKWPGRDS